MERVGAVRGPPLLPVAVTVTLAEEKRDREALTVKLTSVNVDSGSAVTEVPVTVKSPGTGTKVPTVPVWSVAA
jgi:poly-gamma-glutamate capsule biosynthesis protein CapA/YwtB (metallophosphatase superfamily)